MIYFLRLIFILVIGQIIYMVFFEKPEKPIPKQIVIKAKDGKTKIIILRNK